jgi:hypothetical protein
VSGVFKAIGKVFKTVAKTVVKIAPFALAAAAVVFTGGAALGILPTFGAAVGGLVSSLGLSAAVTGALTGAITSAGFGAALGFVTGGKKGLQKGALMGALTGGALGAFSPATFGIVKGADGAVTTAHNLASSAATAASKGIAPVSSSLLNPQPLASIPGDSLAQTVANMPTMAGGSGIAASASAAGSGIAPVSSSLVNAPAIAPADPTPYMSSAVTPQGASQAIGSIQTATGGIGGIPSSGGAINGILDVVNKNPTLVGSLLTALGSQSGVNSKDLAKQVNAEMDLKTKLDALAYGGAYAGKADPFGIGNQNYMIPTPRFYYDAKNNTVVDRQATQGA